MTVNTAAKTTYSTTGIREQLSDIIYDISPMETPFMSACRKGEAAKARFIDWQTDALAAAAANAHIEGDDATYLTATQTTRVRNYIQQFEKSIIVSDIANAVTTAGRKEEMAYQISKRSKEIKRDIEFAVVGANTASDDGSTLTAGKLGSITSWLESNATRGSGGASGGFTSTNFTVAATDVATSVTNRLTFTEARLKAIIKECWDEGGDPALILVGSFNKQNASAFAGIATKYQDLNPGGSKSSSAGVKILGAADWYVSDFGSHHIVPDRFSRARDVFCLDMDYWSMHYLEQFQVVPLARTGSAEKRLLKATLTLCSKNEKASGVIADTLTS
jgi:Family of unknown function (DUF5309)